MKFRVDSASLLHHLGRTAALAAALACAGPAAQAQPAWPTAKPISLIVPFTAGGGTDVIARVVAERLSERLGQTVVIENVAGAGGTIGTAKAAQSAPDGYTFLMGVDSPVAIAQYVNPQSVKYDSLRDLAPIGLVATEPMVIMGRPGLDANTFADVLKLAKAQPARLTYATSGVGSVLQLAMERIKQQAGVDILHVPYRGGAQAIADLAGNQVDLAILPTGSSVPVITSRRVKGLAVTDGKRLASLPDVASITELPGLKDLAMTTWIGLFAPASTPMPVLVRMNTELNAVLQMPDVRKKFSEHAITPGGGAPEAFASFVKSEQTRYAQLVKSANIHE